jgi:exosome complex RNA-binding protein Rrp42 (RNase PH superfamily)
LSVDSSQRQTVSHYAKKDITDLHQDMKYLIEEFMLKPLDKKGLCLIKGKICWVVNIDVFCLSVLKEIYIDKISLGIRAALHDLEIPELTITQNQITSEFDVEVVEDKIKKVSDFIHFDKIPVLVTIGEVNSIKFQ